MLGEACWPEIAAPTVLVPLGSLEQHGPHLPLDTDTRIATAVATRVGTAGTPESAVVAAPVAYGASGEHEGFPGTISIGSAALTTLLVELVRSASRTFPRVVLVCGHGGNSDGVGAALARLHYERRDVAGWFGAVPAGDAHAGRTETSLLLAIAPHLVRPGPWPAGATEPIAELMPALRAGGVRRVSPNGVLGDPTGATAAEGERLLDLLAGRLAALLHPTRRSA